MLVKPGSKGWSLASAGGLAKGEVADLATRFPVAGGVRAPELEHRVMPARADVEDPQKVP